MKISTSGFGLVCAIVLAVSPAMATTPAAHPATVMHSATHHPSVPAQPVIFCASGRVTEIDASHLTAMIGRETRAYALTSTTRYDKNGKTIASSEIVKGDGVKVCYTESLVNNHRVRTATKVQLLVAHHAAVPPAAHH